MADELLKVDKNNLALSGGIEQVSGEVRTLRLEEDDDGNIFLPVSLFVGNGTKEAFEQPLRASDLGSSDILVGFGKMIMNLHDTIILLSRKITLLTEVLKGGIGGGAHELTLDDIEED